MTTPAPERPEAPCFVFDLDRFDAKHALLREGLGSAFDHVELGYSYKTCWLPALCRRAHELGAWAEVVSRLEYRLAQRLGVPESDILYNGPAKRFEDVAAALKGGARLNLDSLEEVEHAVRFARDAAEPCDVGLRVSLPVSEGDDPDRPSRFGLSVADGEFEEAVRRIEASDGRLRLVGLHGHLSTKARDCAVFRRNAEHLGRAAARVRDDLRYLDLGGGLGFAPPGMPGLAYPAFAEIAAACRAGLDATLGEGLAGLEIVFEPGIAWTGDCAFLLTRVEAIKQRGGRTLAVLDTSIHDVKPSRHRHNHPARRVEPEGVDASPDAETLPQDLVGYTCMEDDRIAIDQALPPLAPGDVLRIDNVGAYTFVFKPRFIRGTPAIWVVRGGHAICVKAGDDVDTFAAGHVL